MPDTVEINEAAYTKALEAYYAADQRDDMQPFRAAVLAYHKAALPAARPVVDEALVREMLAKFDGEAMYGTDRTTGDRRTQAMRRVVEWLRDRWLPQGMPEGPTAVFVKHPLPWAIDAHQVVTDANNAVVAPGGWLTTWERIVKMLNASAKPEPVTGP